MKRNVFVYALAVLLTLMTVSVYAQGPRGMAMGRGMQQGNQPMMCRQALGLTQAQVADIQKLRAAFVKDTAALRAQLQTEQQEMMKLWTATDPDLTQIKAKAAEMDQVRAQVQDKAIDLHYAVFTTVLTPDQRTKCIQLCKSGQCGMGCGMGAGMGPGGMGMGMGAGMGPNGAGCPMMK